MKLLDIENAKIAVNDKGEANLVLFAMDEAAGGMRTYAVSDLHEIQFPEEAKHEEEDEANKEGDPNDAIHED